MFITRYSPANLFDHVLCCRLIIIEMSTDIRNHWICQSQYSSSVVFLPGGYHASYHFSLLLFVWLNKVELNLTYEFAVPIPSWMISVVWACPTMFMFVGENASPGPQFRLLCFAMGHLLLWGNQGPLGFFLTVYPIVKCIQGEVLVLLFQDVWHVNGGKLCGSLSDLSVALKTSLS